MALLIDPPARPAWLLRPALWLAAKIAKKDTLPAQLLAHFAKGAIGAGVLEALAPSPSDLDARVLAMARIAASAVSGCPFCLDMNAASWRRAGLSPGEARALIELEPDAIERFDPRERAAVRYAVALSRTPVVVDEPLAESVRALFSPREIVVLAEAIALVNFWARFNQGLGVPSAGFFDERACATSSA